MYIFYRLINVFNSIFKVVCYIKGAFPTKIDARLLKFNFRNKWGRGKKLDNYNNSTSAEMLLNSVLPGY